MVRCLNIICFKYNQFCLGFILIIYLILIFFRIITGCYDNSIHIWTSKGKHKIGISGHSGPVKAVQWISVSSDKATFVR